MANIPVTNLPVATSLDGTEIAMVVQAGVTSRTTTAAIAALATPVQQPPLAPTYATLTLVPGTSNDVVLPGSADYFLDVAGANDTVTGFVAQRNGQRLTITNISNGVFTLAALLGSASANQFRFPNNVLLLQYQSVTIQYSQGMGKWVIA